MTTGYLGKQTNDWQDTVGSKAQNERENMWGPITGTVVSFDPSNQTATIQPDYKPIHDGEKVTMPQLFEVPVDMHRVKSGAITFPVEAGTKVMLNPSMRSMENYDAEEDGSPSDMRSFHLADMRATIIGGDSVSKPLENYDAENAHFRFDEQGQYGIRGSKEGKFKIEGSQGNIYQLYNNAVDQIQQGFDKLSTEPALIHTGDYASIAAELASILAMLRAMEL